MSKLLKNPRQQKFVDLVISGRTQYDAYIEAGYKPRSRKAADANASRLISNDKIKAYITAKRAELQRMSNVTETDVIRETARIALFDPRKLFNDDGTPKKMSELDDDTAAAIGGVEVFEEYDGRGEGRVCIGFTKKFRVFDKNAALENLFKKFGLFIRKVDVTSGGQPIQSSVIVVPAFKNSVKYALDKIPDTVSDNGHNGDGTSKDPSS